MRKACFFAGLFSIAAATLMLELIQTRIISVMTWYHLAFFVISTAMFGLTAGAVWVYLRRDRFTQATLSFDLAHYSTAFALATAVALAFQMTLTPVATLSLTSVLIWIEFAALLSVPFFFSGVVVTLALTRSPFPVGRVYGVDLIGAASGCFGVLLLLEIVDGPSAVLWTAVFTAMGGWLFALSGIGHAPARPPRFAALLGRRHLWFALITALAALNSTDGLRLGFYPVFAKGHLQLQGLPWLEKWNSFSRVVANEPVEEAPAMWGPSPSYDGDGRTVVQSWLNIDGDAATVAYGIEGDLRQARFLRYDITNLAYRLPGRESAAVIGVGGGRDLLSAKLFGVAKVTGVEINPVFVDLLTRHPDLSGFVGLKGMDGLSLIVDEARSWFARSDESFDLIQMSLIDTWAATGAGAFTLSENGLYTVEAWEIFLNHLTPGGVFTVSRWYAPEDIAESGRMVSLAVASLLKAGVKTPRDHIFLAASDRIATLVVSRSGFNAEELLALQTTTQRLQFRQLIGPRMESAVGILETIVAARSLQELARGTQSAPLDLTPPTDDRPFFFNQLPLYDAPKLMALTLAGRTPGVGYGNLFATATLVMLFLIALGAVIAAIIIPLRPGLKDVGRRLVAGGTAYFVLIGTGFMLVEIGLLQRFSVFLGHPIHALSVVLFSLILSAGAGSLLSDYVPTSRKPAFVVWALATGAYIFALLIWAPSLLHWLQSSSLGPRALLSIALILPMGLLMGFGFPTGMRFIAAVDRRPTAWFWGINGASGVLASAVAVAASIAHGIATTVSLGAVCYFLLIPAAFVIGFPEGGRGEQK